MYANIAYKAVFLNIVSARVVKPSISPNDHQIKSCPAETSSHSFNTVLNNPSTSFMEFPVTEKTPCSEKLLCSENSQHKEKSQCSEKPQFSKNLHYNGNLRCAAPNWIEEEISKLSEKTKQGGGQNFWRLIVFLKKQIPEETEDNLLAAVNLVRDSYGKLTGVSRDTIMSEVKTILKKYE